MWSDEAALAWFDSQRDIAVRKLREDPDFRILELRADLEATMTPEVWIRRNIVALTIELQVPWPTHGATQREAWKYDALQVAQARAAAALIKTSGIGRLVRFLERILP